MKAVFLAAGLGKRLHPITLKVPKGLIEIEGKTLLERAVETLEKFADPEKVIFVTGHGGNLIKDKFGLGERFLYVDNPHYSTKNNIYSLYLAFPHIGDDSFLLFNSDVLFHPEILKRALAGSFDTFLIIDNTKELGEEEMKVIIENDRIRAISKGLDPALSHGEYIGISRFSREGGRILRKHIEELIRNGKDGEFYEAGIQLMLDEYPVMASYTGGLPWIEIDDHKDLEKAKEMARSWDL